jgi:hypothetical protein
VRSSSATTKPTNPRLPGDRLPPPRPVEWLRAKEARLAQEEKQQAHLKKTIDHE